MRTVNIHDAKTHLSQIAEEVRHGETVILAKAGTPIARITPLDAPDGPTRRRSGFLPQLVVPDDFDTMGGDALAASFGAE